MSRRSARIVHTAVDAGDGQKRDSRRARPFEGQGARARGRTGCHDIVNEQNAFACDAPRPAGASPALKGFGYVAPAPGVAEAGLGERGSHALQCMDGRNAAPPGDLPRQQIGLVEPSVPLPAPVQRNWRYGFETLVARHGGQQQIRQGARQRLDSPVLVEVNQFPKDTLVGPITIGRIKATEPIAAQSAAPFGIQWEAVLKRGPATVAEEFGAQRLGRVQAETADRNARDLVERPTANAAIVGEEERKKGVRGVADYRGTDACDCGSPAT